MGFTTILDVIGSMIIGGFLMLILYRTNSAAVENTYNNGSDLTVQENLAAIVEVLENDFRKIGYCSDWTKIPDPTKAIIYADSTSIKFLTDINNTGNVDTLYYYLGPTSDLAGTPNPNDRCLYRIVDGVKTSSANLGITEFSLLYFGALGDTLSLPITVPGEIASMQITIRVENSEAYNYQYVDAFWRQIRLAARNLRNR